jgi:hypothetical protein
MEAEELRADSVVLSANNYCLNLQAVTLSPCPYLLASTPSSVAARIALSMPFPADYQGNWVSPLPMAADTARIIEIVRHGFTHASRSFVGPEFRVTAELLLLIGQRQRSLPNEVWYIVLSFLPFNGGLVTETSPASSLPPLQPPTILFHSAGAILEDAEPDADESLWIFIRLFQ